MKVKDVLLADVAKRTVVSRVKTIFTVKTVSWEMRAKPAWKVQEKLCYASPQRVNHNCQFLFSTPGSVLTFVI